MSEPLMAESPTETSEVVYALGTQGSNTVKIGRTVNLEKRFASIQTMSPVPLVVLWTHPGGSDLESKLHQFFEEIRSHGEWFVFTEDPVAAIKSAVENESWVADAEAKRLARAAQRAAARKRVADLGPAYEAALNEVRAIEDPPERFKEARAFRSAIAESDRSLRQLQKEVILALKEQGLSWREVGDRLDMSGSRAEAIAKGRKFG
jgi:hypothetical protein